MSQLSNNIYNYIKENSGMETLKTVRKYEKTLKKLARYRNHLTFAIRCKSFHIQPKGLRLKCALRTPKTRSIVETAERKLLHEHIHGIVQTIRTLKNDSRGYQLFCSVVRMSKKERVLCFEMCVVFSTSYFIFLYICIICTRIRLRTT